MALGDEFGRIGADVVRAVTLENANGLRARLIGFGARLTELHLPDRDGAMADVVLGFDTLEAYLASDAYFGATCGRYGNRIAGGRFSVDGIAYQVDRNEGPNHLHGGREGFDRKNWSIVELSRGAVAFEAVSEDGEMGFPGRCTLRSHYALTDDDRLIVTMEADATRTTPMNMVNHSYFNLAGQGSGDVLGQSLRLASRFYTPVGDGLLATGEVLAVADTPFDFREAKPLGRDIGRAPGGNYDHNWCLDGVGDALRDCAEAVDPASGRRMMLSTTEPGVQVYTGGYLSDLVTGKAGKRLCKFAGFTLETQKFPGSPDFAHFPDCLLRPGEAYRHQMVFAFSTVEAS